MVDLGLALHFLLLAVSEVLDLHQQLRSLSLPFNPIHDIVFVALEDAKAALEGLEHARVFIFDPLRHDQRAKAIRCSDFVLAILE